MNLLSKVLLCQSCMNIPFLIDLNSNEYNQGRPHYLIMASLGRCNGSCNKIYEPSGRIHFSNKTEDLHLNVFNLIKELNRSKRLIKHISCNFKCKFYDRKCNSNWKWNNNCQCKCKTLIKLQDFFWNPSTCACDSFVYLKIIKTCFHLLHRIWDIRWSIVY